MSRRAATNCYQIAGAEGQPKRLQLLTTAKVNARCFETIKALIPNLFESARPRTAAKDTVAGSRPGIAQRVATVQDEMSAGPAEKALRIIEAAFNSLISLSLI